MASKGSKSKGKGNNKNQSQKSNHVEDIVLEHFKEIAEESDKLKVKELLKEIKEKAELIYTESEKIAITEANERVKEKLADADDKVERKLRDADIKAEKEVERIIKEKTEKIIQKENEVKDKEILLEKEYSKKLKNLDESKEKIDKIKEEIHEEYISSKTKVYDNCKEDLQKDVEKITKEVEKQISELKNKVEKTVEELIKEYSEKENLLIKNAELEVKSERQESLMKQLQVITANYPVSKVTQLEEELKLSIQRESKYKEMMEDYSNQIAELNSKVITYISDPDIERKYNELLLLNQDLHGKLSNLPDEYEIENMRLKLQEYERISEERNELQEIVNTLRIQIDQNKLSQIELSRLKISKQALENEINNAHNELKRIKSDFDASAESRFPALSTLDNEFKDYNPSFPTRSNFKLKGFVEQFRNYLCLNKDLYYSEKTIRAFISGMASSRLIILEGLSGTGKSRLSQEFGNFINSKTSLISVQQSWRDRNELLGYYNEFTKVFKETDFLKSLYRASLDKDRIHIILLDEMNIARVEYYFADFLSVLEREDQSDWKISLVSTQKGNDPKNIIDGKIIITNNVWFVGTANHDDSTFVITDKVYDRAIPIYFHKKEKEFMVTSASEFELSVTQFNKAIENAISNQVSGENLEKIEKLDEFMKDKFDITFGNRIDAQLNRFIPVYIECGGTFEEAFDLLFERKILRKLENQFGIQKNEYEELKETIKEIFGQRFEGSFRYIEKLIGRL